MKRILLLTDFSENSINAMRYGLSLFEKSDCTFYVLHVQKASSYISDDLMYASNESVYESLVGKSKSKLKALVEELELEYNNPNYSFECVVDYDNFTDAIKQLISSKNIDFIVMGTNGVTGAKEFVFGSNTINVIRKIKSPVLIIPENYKFTKPKSILLSLDPMDSLGGQAFVSLLDFVKQHHLEVHILRIKPNNKALHEELEDSKHIAYFLKDMRYTYHVIHNTTIPLAVDLHLQNNAVDIIGLLVQKESFFERSFFKSSTSEINKFVKVPLLIYHTI